MSLTTAGFTVVSFNSPVNAPIDGFPVLGSGPVTIVSKICLVELLYTNTVPPSIVLQCVIADFRATRAVFSVL